MPLMERELGISKSGLGLFLTLHGVLYGVSKFANGFFGDRCNARAFMVVGLVASALMNVSSASAPPWYAGSRLDAQRLVPRHGLPALRAADDPLVPAEGLRHQDVHLEHLPLPRRRADPGAVRLRCWLRFPGASAFSSRRPSPWSALFISGSPSPTRPRPSACPRSKGPAPNCRSRNRAPNSGPSSSKAVFRNKYIWLVSLANFFVYTLRYAHARLGSDAADPGQTSHHRQRRLDGRGLRSRRGVRRAA